jgi:hypothetical protein
LKTLLWCAKFWFTWAFPPRTAFRPVAATFTWAGKEISTERILSDYRSIGGFRFPYGFTYKGRNGIMNGRMEKIEFNVPFDKETFRIPDRKN